MAKRTRRIARRINPPVGTRVLVNARYAADPAWIRHAAEWPGLVMTLDGIPALAHARSAAEVEAIRSAMLENRPLACSDSFHVLAYEDRPTIENKELRKRETPFLMELRPGTVREIERASYFGAYKGVTDILTKYLWPEWALVLTRIAARLGITPNMVTATGAVFCIAATVAFAYGQYWPGLALGLMFMVLDTVDGKLARCTITSSKWGNVFDHGIDLIHPPFWWWFWAAGLSYRGLALPDRIFALVMIAIIGGYVLQRVIEGVFIRQNGMQIHVWQSFDSAFRLITARRNPNMVILFVSLLLGRPDWGIIAVAWWTVISLVVHAVRLVQAWRQRAQGAPITSWLAEA